jgi:hypothetical protein
MCPSIETCRSQEQAEQRADCINKLVAICVKADRTPQGNAFADYVHKICWKHFCCRWREAQDYIDTLLIKWRFDHWKSKVGDNLYLSDEEKQAWMRHIDDS